MALTINKDFPIALAFGLSLFLSTTIELVPLILLLSTLLCYIPHILKLPRPEALARSAFLWGSLSTGLTIAHSSPSIHALSTPIASVISLAVISGATTLFALAPLAINAKFGPNIHHPWSRITAFPTLWALTWFGVSHVTLIGRLTSWSPISGLNGYSWLAQFTGPVGFDWIAAAWAVVIAHALQPLFVDRAANPELLIDHQPTEDETGPRQTGSLSVYVLGAILTILVLPSFILPDLPLPTYSPDTTPFGVGCILPVTSHSGRAPSLKDFISESRKFVATTDVLLWPEGAVRFEDADARNTGLNEIGKALPGHLVGVGFEEFDSSNPNVRGRRRTGLALIHREGKANSTTRVELMYYKRHLVPIAESFSLSQSEEPPSIFTLDLGPPSGTNKTDWASAPNYTRPIPITASICLDFAWPSAFTDLDTRPALILAPARTWHTAVGVAMWEQAKARAEELGSTVLWCDGGAGGVSGIAGRGIHEVTHIGQGSWARKIGIQWPFDERRTVYGLFGEGSVLVALLVLSSGSLAWIGFRERISLSYLTRLDIGQFWTGITNLRERLGWTRPRPEVEGERAPLLIDT